MIDIHTHILPGLDDGARDMDDSLEMAAIAAQSGVHALAATSHANTGGFFSEYSVEEYMKRLSDFRRELDREAIPLTVLSGMEIFMTHEVPDMIREERLLPLNETDYFLMEFSFGIEQEEMDELIDGVMEQGCLTQVNRGSIFGRFGERAKICADHLLSKRMVTCIASDAHKPYERTTYMADIKEYMEDHYSFEYSKKLLYDNPKKIFEGKKIIQK